MQYQESWPIKVLFADKAAEIINRFVNAKIERNRQVNNNSEIIKESMDTFYRQYYGTVREADYWRGNDYQNLTTYQKILLDTGIYIKYKGWSPRDVLENGLRGIKAKVAMLLNKPISVEMVAKGLATLPISNPIEMVAGQGGAIPNCFQLALVYS